MPGNAARQPLARAGGCRRGGRLARRCSRGGVSMRAVLIHETGGPEVLRLEEAARPEPQDGQVLIRVHAVSVNPIEWKHRRGLIAKQLPAVLGSDVSGTVEVSRADGFAVGEDVFGLAASGGYAELATAAADRIASKPAGISHEQAAPSP